jgi:leucine dehydrogenase
MDRSQNGREPAAMNVFDSPSFDRHENVVFAHDPASGLHAIIAVHSLALGPAAGGCRMWPYTSTSEALEDVLRLSRGMSYKNAMAELPFGGGKAVIIGDPQKDKTEALFEALGTRVQALGGQYITAEDVGTTVRDMEIVARKTSFVSGLRSTAGHFGGDPSPKTALGVFLGITTAVKHRLGRQDVSGLTVAVQGVGGVGYHLCHLLARAGADLVVADVKAQAAERVAQELGALVVPAHEILSIEADVLAPCALGGILDRDSILKLRAPIVAGGANNQLRVEEDGQRLLERGVLYAPDYVINAGGIISVAHEHFGLGGESDVDAAIGRIPQRLAEIFELSRLEHRPTNRIANALAEERIRSARRKAAA